MHVSMLLNALGILITIGTSRIFSSKADPPRPAPPVWGTARGRTARDTRPNMADGFRANLRRRTGEAEGGDGERCSASGLTRVRLLSRHKELKLKETSLAKRKWRIDISLGVFGTVHGLEIQRCAVCQTKG